MIVVTVKENESLDKALKRFKKKFERTKILKEIRNRAYFEKPSVRNRQAKLRSLYKQRLIAEGVIKPA